MLKKLWILIFGGCEHKWEDVGNRQYDTCVDFFQKCSKCGERRTIQG